MEKSGVARPFGRGTAARAREATKAELSHPGKVRQAVVSAPTGATGRRWAERRRLARACLRIEVGAIGSDNDIACPRAVDVARRHKRQQQQGAQEYRLRCHLAPPTDGATQKLTETRNNI